MPVTKRKQMQSVASEAHRRRLVDEWGGKGTQEPRPHIIEEEDARGVTAHVYVVWEDWGDLDQQERSEAITEAFWEVYGASKGLELLVAMGLTPAEAKRMGISGS